MKKTLSYLVLLSLLMLGACNRKAHVISRSEMADIYAEMFLVDDQMKSLPFTLRRMADTTAVYAAIFDKYGYTVQDYLASQEYYLQDAGRYGRILKKSITKLEKAKGTLQSQLSQVETRQKAKDDLKRFIPDSLYIQPSLDSVYIDCDSLHRMLRNNASI